eukprot:gene16420-57979_t
MWGACAAASHSLLARAVLLLEFPALSVTGRAAWPYEVSNRGMPRRPETLQ